MIKAILISCYSKFEGQLNFSSLQKIKAKLIIYYHKDLKFLILIVWKKFMAVWLIYFCSFSNVLN